MEKIQDQSKAINWFNTVSFILFIILAALLGILYLMTVINWVTAVVPADGKTLLVYGENLRIKNNGK